MASPGSPKPTDSRTDWILAPPANGEGADTVRLAQDALIHGQLALAAGDTATAMRWLDRACRLAPTDRTLTVALATACLDRDPERAAALFTRVTGMDDVREAWLGLAAANLRRGRHPAAAQALAQALHRHAPGARLTAAGSSVAEDVVRASGAAGWCGLSSDGQLVVRTTNAARPNIRLDGRRCGFDRLPENWQRAHRLTVEVGGRPLIGSPLDVAAIRRSVGFVEAHAGGLRGWAWHPGDPESAVALTIRSARGRGSLSIEASEIVDGLQWAGALARPRGFTVPAAALVGYEGLLHVRGSDDRDLLGSPLDPAGETLATTAAAMSLSRLYPAGVKRRPMPSPAPPPAMPADIVGQRPAAVSRPRRRPVAVVVPVHGGGHTVLACLDSVLATVRPPNLVVVVDDASPEPDLAQALDELASRKRIRLVRHLRNLGFPGAANAGIARCPRHDVILLNSDTLVPPGWLERLRDATGTAPDIGSATPLSNQASVLSYPDAADLNPIPTLADTIALDTVARRANPATVVDIPVGVGFCLYLRRDCIDDVGLLRADVFAQGYGEENDFCLRARHLGWRHVAVPGLFVGHLGGASFGSAGRHLQLRNEALLNRLHPGYGALVQDFFRRDPLADSRRRFDLARWRAGRQRGQGSVILISHDQGGGVERQLTAAASAHRATGLRPIVLRPQQMPDGNIAVVVSDGPERAFPNLRFALPDELTALLALLRAERPCSIDVHHLLGHPPAIHELIARLRLPYEVHIHDYAWFCPRVSLVGAERRYCGEPAPVHCEACVADAGRLIDEDIGVAALRERSARFLAAARQVIAPSADAAARLRRHFPALRPVVVPHEDDTRLDDPPPRARPTTGRARVCVLGAIGLHKGYDVLLACARDAEHRRLPLEFVVVGHTIDDARLLATGRVFITGRYRQEEVVELIAAQYATIGLLPSIWPETWSLGLTELWRGGLRVVAFDFGAPAERIRHTGRGVVLPLGLTPPGINNALVAATSQPVHEGS